MRHEITNRWFRILPALILFGVMLLAAANANAQEQPATSLQIELGPEGFETNGLLFHVA